jgi:hypothetical protein
MKYEILIYYKLWFNISDWDTTANILYSTKAYKGAFIVPSNTPHSTTTTTSRPFWSNSDTTHSAGTVTPIHSC